MTDDDKRAYPAPTPAEDLLRALHDPLGYWEERAAHAERALAEARATKNLHKERAEEMAERLSIAEAAVARVLALAEHWDAQALEQAAYGENATAAIFAIDARALRQAINGSTDPDELDRLL